ncbi:MAG TPA: hypothetical protein VHC48_16505 [Puia sp.]|jgi:hypothetical protein|nr:hypothetical protein [Puia sp.]
MENLKTESIKMQLEGSTQEFELNEKDFGDQVVFDISREGQYLMTIGKDGSILFMNFDAPESERKIFKLSFLDRFVEKIKSVS